MITGRMIFGSWPLGGINVATVTFGMLKLMVFGVEERSPCTWSCCLVLNSASGTVPFATKIASDNDMVGPPVESKKLAVLTVMVASSMRPSSASMPTRDDRAVRRFLAWRRRDQESSATARDCHVMTIG